MIKYVDVKGVLRSLEVAAVEKVDEKIFNQLDGSIGEFGEVRLDWLQKMGWSACYSRDGDFAWYDKVSLIRYCKKKEIAKMLAISIFYIMDKRKPPKARVFNATWTGLRQALWGVKLERSMPDYDLMDGAWVEAFLVVPDGDEVFEFLLMRDVCEGVVLAGPEEFLEYMVSRSKGEWYVGNSLEFRREEKIFITQKDRKTAIREDKMKRY